MLVVEKLPGASTLAVTKGVEDALEELQPGCPTSEPTPRCSVSELHRQRDGNLEWALVSASS